jgi:hypothetical protein
VTDLRRALTRPIRLVLVAAFLALAAATFVAPEASARASAAPCWKKLISDWYDGRIDNSYELHCYKDALRHLPDDVKTYSDAVDVITRALADATRGKTKVDENMVVPPPVQNVSNTTSGTTSGTTTTSPDATTTSPDGTVGPGNGGGDGGSETTASDDGPINDVLGSGDAGADGIPLPLLVLGGLALLLVAAGAAGLIARHMQTRRAQP